MDAPRTPAMSVDPVAARSERPIDLLKAVGPVTDVGMAEHAEKLLTAGGRAGRAPPLPARRGHARPRGRGQLPQPPTPLDRARTEARRGPLRIVDAGAGRPRPARPDGRRLDSRALLDVFVVLSGSAKGVRDRIPDLLPAPSPSASTCSRSHARRSRPAARHPAPQSCGPQPLALRAARRAGRAPDPWRVNDDGVGRRPHPHEGQDVPGQRQRAAAIGLIEGLGRDPAGQAVRVARRYVVLIERGRLRSQLAKVASSVAHSATRSATECPRICSAPRAYRKPFRAFSAACWQRKQARLYRRPA